MLTKSKRVIRKKDSPKRKSVKVSDFLPTSNNIVLENEIEGVK